MKVAIEPLAGKYYGTTIMRDNGIQMFDVWFMGNLVPSDRQLRRWGMTDKEAREDGMMSDNHYETQQGYDIALAVCKALASLDF